MDDQVYDPVETAPVPLFGGVVLAARSTDGLLWLAVQDLAIASFRPVLDGLAHP